MESEDQLWKYSIHQTGATQWRLSQWTLIHHLCSQLWTYAQLLGRERHFVGCVNWFETYDVALNMIASLIRKLEGHEKGKKTES